MLAASSAAGLEVIFRRSPATGAAWWFSSAFFGTAHWSADGEKCYKYPEKPADKNFFLMRTVSLPNINTRRLILGQCLATTALVSRFMRCNRGTILRRFLMRSHIMFCPMVRLVSACVGARPLPFTPAYTSSIANSSGGAVMVQNDHYEILAAKTEYREAYNSGDLDCLLNVFAAQFTDCSDGEPSFDGEEAVRALRQRVRELFQRFRVEMVVIVIDVVVKGNFAYDRGWHKVRLISKDTGRIADTKYRYFETWAKQSGTWKIDYIITNKELPPQMLSEEDGDSNAAVTTGSQTIA